MSSKDYLIEKIGVPVQDPSGSPKGLDYRLYEGLAHGTNVKELRDVQDWLIKVLPATPSDSAP